MPAFLQRRAFGRGNSTYGNVSSLLRTCRSCLNPRLRQLAEHFLRSGRGGTAFARMPRPADQTVSGIMLLDIRKGAIAVAFGIFDLRANFADSQPHPPHAYRWQMPRLMAGYAAFIADELDVLRTVARCAMQAGRAKTAFVPADYRWIMGPHFITLSGQFPDGMAVHATRVCDHLRHLVEQGF